MKIKELGLFVVLTLLALGFNSFANQSYATSRTAVQPSKFQSQMLPLLQKLSQEFSIDHTVHWKHSVPHIGDVTTSISLAPTNFDGCSVVWSQTQEGTVYGQLLYIETHRFDVPLSSIDAKGISVSPVTAGQSQRPGIEPDDYYTVLLKSATGKNTVNMVDQDIIWDKERGPIASVEQLKVSSAWLRVRQEERGELLKTQFQQAIAACVAAGQ
ncbi:MAG TPA: hypothetical protein VN875_04315 [Candidatus Binatus sp.]|jgi:hypothetical protein|nr:hypothetical protein [Candidatus Binatus sp.]